MDETLLTVIGFAAAIGTTGAWLPQVRKTLVTRSARDFSWGYLFLLTTGVVLWIVYGVMRRDLAVTGANVVTALLVTCVVWVKSREKPSEAPKAFHAETRRRGEEKKV